MPVVSVRLPEKDVAFLKERGKNLSEVIRDAVHEKIEWIRWEEAQKRLQAARFKPSGPAEDLIREDRDRAH